MIFLPNKYERFCASIRNRIQNRNSSLPLTVKSVEILRKIYFAEALLKESEIAPIDVKKYAENLLGAVQILRIEREEHFAFKITAEGKFLLDKKSFEILLILLAKKCKNVTITEYKAQLVISADVRPDRKLEKLFKKMNAYSFYENKSGCMFAVFSAAKTLKNSIVFSCEQEILSDPFSSVNIFS